MLMIMITYNSGGITTYNSNQRTSSSITTPIQPLTTISGTHYLMLGANITTDTANVETIANVGSVEYTSTIKPF